MGLFVGILCDSFLGAMAPNKRLNLGISAIADQGVHHVSVRLPKATLEALGLVPGMNVECLAFTDPFEIIIRPQADNPASCDGYIDQAIERKPWGLVSDAS
jgi:antitoxin component of MazEF toxin-antitoxin module